jgi:hypothetical protein
MSTLRPGPIRVYQTVSDVGGFRRIYGIDVIFPHDVLFSPEQFVQARAVMGGYRGEKLDERLCRRVEMSLEGWLNGLLVREELVYDHFDRQWRPREA